MNETFNTDFLMRDCPVRLGDINGQIASYAASKNTVQQTQILDMQIQPFKVQFWSVSAGAL